MYLEDRVLEYKILFKIVSDQIILSQETLYIKKTVDPSSAKNSLFSIKLFALGFHLITLMENVVLYSLYTKEKNLKKRHIIPKITKLSLANQQKIPLPNKLVLSDINGLDAWDKEVMFLFVSISFL